MLIQPNEKCRIPVPVKRCPLSLANIDHHLKKHDGSLKHNDLVKGDDFLDYIFPTAQMLDAILNQCRLNLLNQLNLKWNIPNTNVEGIALADEVPYSDEMLKSLLIPPIQSGAYSFNYFGLLILMVDFCLLKY